MLSYLYGMKQMGQETVSEKDLLIKTNYSRTDSKGYRDAMKRLCDDGHVEKAKGSVSLTDDGKSYVEEYGLAEETVQAVTMADHQALLKAHIVNNAKAPEAKVVAVWNVLLDGKLHDASELLEVSEYSRTDSKGYREIMMWLNRLDLLEKNGKKFRFTDKMYQLGDRPN
jgi:predicted methyltransferase